MFDELDQLLDITRTIESSPITNPMMEAEEDLDAIYVDYGDSNTPLDAKPLVTKITSKVAVEEEPKDEKVAPGECSGNETSELKRGPLFEEQPGEDGVTDEEPIQEGLGIGKISLDECVEKGMGMDFMRMYKLECSGQTCAQQGGLMLGDVVHHGNDPVLFVVKKADGDVVTAAKPTSNPNELLTNCDGEWPTFTFRAHEIQPMLNASIEDVNKIIDFNDQAMPFDGSTVDDTPMKCAQNDAKCNMVDRIADRLDEVLGMPYKDICAGKDPSCKIVTEPTEVVIINPDGSYGTMPQMGGYKVKIGD